MKTNLRALLHPVLWRVVLIAGLGFGFVAADSSAATVPPAKPTIVLVHGAFAESGSWNGVMARLLAQGYPVIAVAVPLRGVKSDSDYLAAVFKGISGPIVAVGHSYGGMLITEAAAGNPNVNALVYVAAFAPEAGESGGDLAGRFPGGTLGPTLAPPVLLPDGGKDLYIQQDKYHAQFAADVPEVDAKLMAAAQRPIVEAALHEPARSATWRMIPSWFIFGSLDKNIPEAAHLFMAARAKARETVNVQGASHVVMISHAEAVAALIDRAATVVTAGPVVTSVRTLPVEGRLPSLGDASDWLNSPPLTPAGLRGKVVLIQFWTYSCINWLRTLPYVRAWEEKYRDQGLVVIGVHTPEFGFEEKIGNVRRAAQDRAIGYPVAVDNDRAVWRAFGNQYWPALYFVDAQGRIRHHQFGEGEYELSEKIIQQLLAEAGRGGIGPELVSVDARGVEAAADLDNLKSAENYVGYERTANFASPGGARPEQRRVYAVPAHLKPNQWALAGEWTMGGEATVLNQANGRLAYRFHARDLHLVMGPAVTGVPVRFRVLVDGQPPGAAHGLDVDDQGNGTVAEHRLYQLVRQAGPIADRQFEIEFLAPGIEAFSLTFG